MTAAKSEQGGRGFRLDLDAATADALSDLRIELRRRRPRITDSEVALEVIRSTLGIDTENGQRPESFNAEQATLGAMLIDSKAAAEVIAVASSQFPEVWSQRRRRVIVRWPLIFLDRRHRAIAAAIHAVHREGRAIDLVTVANALKRNADAHRIGATVEFLEALPAASPNPDHVLEHFGIIVEKHEARSALRIGRDLIATLSTEQERPAAAIRDAIERFGAIAIRGESVRSMSMDSTETRAHLLEELRRLRDGRSAIPTPIASLNRHVAGWPQKGIAVIRAPMKLGKTSFITNAVLTAAGVVHRIDPAGRVVLIVCEDSPEDFYQRVASALGYVDRDVWLKMSRSYRDPDVIREEIAELERQSLDGNFAEKTETEKRLKKVRDELEETETDLEEIERADRIYRQVVDEFLPSLPIDLFWSAAPKTEAIRDFIENQVIRRGRRPVILFLDYIQKVRPHNRRHFAEWAEKIEGSMEILREWITEFGFSIVCASQSDPGERHHASEKRMERTKRSTLGTKGRGGWGPEMACELPIEIDRESYDDTTKTAQIETAEIIVKPGRRYRPRRLRVDYSGAFGLWRDHNELRGELLEAGVLDTEIVDDDDLPF